MQNPSPVLMVRATAPRFLLTALSLAVLSAYSPAGLTESAYVYPHSALAADKVKTLDEGAYGFKKSDSTGKAAGFMIGTFQELQLSNNTQVTFSNESDTDWKGVIAVLKNRDATLTVEGDKTRAIFKAVVLDAGQLKSQLRLQGKGQLQAESLWLQQGLATIKDVGTKVTVSGNTVLNGKPDANAYLTIDEQGELATKDLILGAGGEGRTPGGLNSVEVMEKGRLTITGKLHSKGAGWGTVRVETGGMAKSKDVALGWLGAKNQPQSWGLVSDKGSIWTSETFKAQDNAYVILVAGGVLDITGSGDAAGSGKGSLELMGANSSLYIGPSELFLDPDDMSGVKRQAGILKAKQVVMEHADQAIAKSQKVVFDHTDADYTFTPGIKSTHGTLRHLGGNTTLASDLSEFKGGVVVDGGVLTINNPLTAGHIQVSEPGSRLVAKQTVTTADLAVSGGAQATLEKDLSWAAGDGRLIIQGAGSQLLLQGTITPDGSEHSRMVMVVEGGSLQTKAVEFSLGEARIAGAGSSWKASTLKLGGQANLALMEDGRLELSEDAGLELAGADAMLMIGSVFLDEVGTAGVLDAKKLVFGGEADDGKGPTLVFNHTNENYIFKVPLSGKGVVMHGAGNTLLQGDSAGFTGTTTVSGGRLRVSDKLGGSLVITGPGQFGGAPGATATIGGTQVQDGGTLLLQNGGQLMVNGDLAFNGASQLSVALDASATPAAPLLAVSGKTTLGDKTVLGFKLSGEEKLSLGTAYTLLTSVGGLEGTFGKTEGNFVFLDATLDYGADKVTYTFTRKAKPEPGLKPDPGSQPGEVIVQFKDAAQTANQQSVAQALETLPEDSQLYQRVLTLTKDQTEATFDTLSGDGYTATAGVLGQVVQPVQALPLARLRGNLNAGLMPGAPLAQSGGAVPVSALPGSAAQPLWAQGFGNWQRAEGSANAPRSRSVTGGVVIGADQAVGDGWRVGAAVGLSATRLDVGTRGMRSDIGSYSATVYGGKSWQTSTGQLNVLLGSAYSWHTIAARRNLGSMGLAQQLKSDYRGNTVQAFAEVGHAFTLSGGFIEPYAGVAVSALSTQAYRERGGNAALKGQALRQRNATFTLGLRGGYDMDLGGRSARLRGGLALRQQTGDLTPRSKLAFVGGGTAFTVSGKALARASVQTELGLDVALSRTATLGLSYGGELAASTQQHTVALNARWAF